MSDYSLLPDDTEKVQRDISEPGRAYPSGFILLRPDPSVEREAEQERARHAAQLEALRAEINVLNRRLVSARQEMYCRIKNSLQVVGSLLDLMEAEPDGDASLIRLQYHLCALEAIHSLRMKEMETQQELPPVSVQAALEKLLPALQAGNKNIPISTSITEVFLTERKATSLCLLIGECVISAARHAKTEVTINLRLEDSMARLEVSGDGEGFPPDFDLHKDETRDLICACHLARLDLIGEMSCENQEQGGGRIIVTFPLNNARGVAVSSLNAARSVRLTRGVQERKQAGRTAGTRRKV